MQKRQVGWRLPVELIERIDEYGNQTHRSTTASVIALVEAALAAAARKGEYTPRSTGEQRE